MNYVDFTSLPPEEEAKFVVFEQRTQESAAKAIKIGAITAGIVGLFLVIVVFSFDKPKNLMADDDMGMMADEEDRAKQRSDFEPTKPPPPPPKTEETNPATPEGGASGASSPPVEGGAGGAAEAGGATAAPATP